MGSRIKIFQKKAHALRVAKGGGGGVVGWLGLWATFHHVSHALKNKCTPCPVPKKKELGHFPDTSGIFPAYAGGLFIRYIESASDPDSIQKTETELTFRYALLDCIYFKLFP